MLTLFSLINFNTNVSLSTFFASFHRPISNSRAERIRNVPDKSNGRKDKGMIHVENYSVGWDTQIWLRLRRFREADEEDDKCI